MSVDDPWVMYLVVRQERLPSAGELFEATARAVVEVTRCHAHDARWQTAFETWSARSFRKVCLRAKERDWGKLELFDHGDGVARGEAVVRALPPRTKSGREKLLLALQAFVGDPFALGVDGRETPEVPVLRFVLNADVAMGAGKLVAQVGHAAMMSLGVSAERESSWAEVWRSAGSRCACARASGDDWMRLREMQTAVVVRDAGLTEVEPGTETVIALAPSMPSTWGDRWRALARV